MAFLDGKLLIAMPDLSDPNFFRTVSLIFHHDEEGAAGLILNRPSNHSIGDVWKDQIGEGWSSHPIHVGGPVEAPLIALHTSLACAERQVIPGVFLSLERDHIDRLVEQDMHQLKVFHGYAGWGAGQLESEIDSGGWVTCDSTVEDVFETPEEIWKQACTKVGNEIIFPMPPKSLEQINPLAN